MIKLLTLTTLSLALCSQEAFGQKFFNQVGSDFIPVTEADFARANGNPQISIGSGPIFDPSMTGRANQLGNPGMLNSVPLNGGQPMVPFGQPQQVFPNSGLPPQLQGLSPGSIAAENPSLVRQQMNNQRNPQAVATGTGVVLATAAATLPNGTPPQPTVSSLPSSSPSPTPTSSIIIASSPSPSPSVKNSASDLSSPVFSIAALSYTMSGLAVITAMMAFV